MNTVQEADMIMSL